MVDMLVKNLAVTMVVQMVELLVDTKDEKLAD